MRTIFFIRHAKSSWKDFSLADIDRPLNGRGKRDGPIMAGKLSQVVAEVDILLCSPAKRARKTAKYFKKAIKVHELKIVDEIYHAWPETLLEIVRNIDDEHKTALIFGHNPGFTTVYNHFSKNRLDNLPTCGIFALRTTSSWSNIDTSNTTVNSLMYPKMY